MKYHAALVVASAFALAGCQTMDSAVTGPTADVLPPVPEAAEFAVGETFVFRDENGTVGRQTVTAIDSEGHVSWLADDGGTWTTMNIFGSTIAWDTPTTTGTQSFTGDSMYPIEVGRTVRIDYMGSDQAESWSGKRRCRTPRQVSVTVEAGTFDTYEIICQQGSQIARPFRTRTYYYSPEIGNYVLRLHTNRDGLSERDELIAYEPAVAEQS